MFSYNFKYTPKIVLKTKKNRRVGRKCRGKGFVESGQKEAYWNIQNKSTRRGKEKEK